MKTVKEVMRKNIPMVSPNDSLKKIAKLMKDNNVWGLPVVEGGHIKGIITDGDMLNAFYINVSTYSYEENLESEGENHQFRKRLDEFRETKVNDVMTVHPRTVSEKTGVDEVAGILKRFKIKRLIVVDDRGNPTGLVERLDVVNSILSE